LSRSAIKLYSFIALKLVKKLQEEKSHLLKDRYQITQDILKKVAEVDQFKGEWQRIKLLHPHILKQLEKITLIQSTASSTRIEGSQMSDKEVEQFLAGLKIQKFRERDMQEVKGYKELLETVFTNYAVIKFSESTIKSFHKLLLKYSEKDQRHLGDYKKQSNTVAAFDEKGKQVGIIFQTTPPYLTPKEMLELVERTQEWFNGEDKHNLFIIAEFIVDFLSIHPFQDGNGRVSRILTNFLLLRSGYEFIRYSSLEKVIEDNKKLYYLALRRSQKDRNTDKENISEWINFFLDVLMVMVRGLEKKVKDKGIILEINSREAQILDMINCSTTQRITSNEVAKKFNITSRAALDVLKKMMKKEWILQKGERDRDTYYVVNKIE
jgi:Fic family protein